MKMVDALAENLRLQRRALGLTQEKLAEISGLSTNYIARLEIGTSTPSFATLIRLSKALQIEPAGLLEMKERAKLDIPSDPGATVITLLKPLSDEETDYVLSQLRSSVSFILSHRKEPSRKK